MAEESKSQSDPRHDPDFRADLFPSCDGSAFPPTLDEQNEKAKLELATAFYRLNIASTKLRNFRQEHGKDRDREIERQLLQEIERALLAKESKEDELARSGISATPTFEGGVAIDLRFCEPDRAQRKTVIYYSSSSSSGFEISLPWDKP